MLKVRMCKLPFETHLFNKNQKVFVVSTTGDTAYQVVGKHRGKGRHVKAWIKWNPNNTADVPDWKEIEVQESFVQQHNLMIF